MKLEEIEKKLDSFNEKLNSLGSNFSDGLNSGLSKADNAVNSKLRTLGQNFDNWSEKHCPSFKDSQFQEGSIMVEDNLKGLGGTDTLSSIDIIKPALKFEEKIVLEKDTVVEEKINLNKE